MADSTIEGARRLQLVVDSARFVHEILQSRVRLALCRCALGRFNPTDFPDSVGAHFVHHTSPVFLNASIPSTRNSLLARLQDSGDLAAWAEFESIYRPAIYRFVRGRNLQPADADDLTQQVMIAVAKKLGQWDPDQSGSFRAFLLTVTRNATLNHLTRRSREHPMAEGEQMTGIQGVVTPGMDEEIDWEFRRAVFRSVAATVREEFKPSTWDSFWLVAVLGYAPSDAAQQLGLSIGAVYVCKSRVIKRIRDRIAELDLDGNGSAS